MAGNLQDDIKSTIKSVAMLPTKHPITGPMIAAARKARDFGASRGSAKPAPKPMHASQMKRRAMSAAERRQHEMMRKRAGR